MKTTQILYLVLFVGVILFIVTSTHLLDRVTPNREGFMDTGLPVNGESEPRIAPSVMPARLSIQAMPNASAPGTLPFGPYAQTAAVGSYQYQDPALLPAELKQMKQLNEDLRSFLVFEGPSIANSSDPTVQLPLTQLRADSRKLEQEIAVLESNAGIQSSLTQQNTADIQEALTFLQRKVRLFQTAGVVSGGVEGFQGDIDVQSCVRPKTRATKADLQGLQTRIYGSILTLSASATKDPVVQSRIKRLQQMYTTVTDMIMKLDKGIWTSNDVPVFKEDIDQILPRLVDPTQDIMDIFSPKQDPSNNGKQLSPVEKYLAGLVGTEAAPKVFNSILDNGSFNVNLELGYGSHDKDRHGDVKMSKSFDLLNNTQQDNSVGMPVIPDMVEDGPAMEMNSAFDCQMPGVDDRHDAKKGRSLGGLDWKRRAEGICEQVRLRGLDPQDFGCIARGSMMSPAYSWRGHTKMVCGRLAATMDPSLPQTCGCPPPKWKGWTLS
jgi:hypothetical protein